MNDLMNVLADDHRTERGGAATSPRERGIHGWAASAPRAWQALTSRAHAAHEVDDHDDEQDQAEAAAAIGRSADVETTAAEEDEQDQDEDDGVHGGIMPHRRIAAYGALTPFQAATRSGGQRYPRSGLRDSLDPHAGQSGSRWRSLAADSPPLPASDWARRHRQPAMPEPRAASARRRAPPGLELGQSSAGHLADMVPTAMVPHTMAVAMPSPPNTAGLGSSLY